MKLRIFLVLLAAVLIGPPALAADKVTPPANLDALPHADVQPILGRWQYPEGDEPVMIFEFKADALAVRIFQANGKHSDGTADADYRQGAPGVIWLITRNARTTPPSTIETPVAVTRLHLVSAVELDMVDAGQDLDSYRIIPLSPARPRAEP